MAMWASNSSTQLRWWTARGALRRHSTHQERHHVMCVPRPYASTSALASASASASENLRSPGFKKPEVIEWQENMPNNSATFIGTVARDLQVHHLSSGKIVANSSLKVKRYLKNSSWFYLEFWDDLAEVAAAHLKIGDRIFVSGSVWQERIIGRDGLKKTFGKVVAKDLKFVQHNSSEYAASVQDYNLKMHNLWKDLFENSADWFDVRGSKKTERYPDFKHKSLNQSLWLKNISTPDWVKTSLLKEDWISKASMSRKSNLDDRFV